MSWAGQDQNFLKNNDMLMIACLRDKISRGVFASIKVKAGFFCLHIGLLHGEKSLIGLDEMMLSTFQ